MQRLHTDVQASLRCVDENEVLYDDNEKYLKRIKSLQVDPPQGLYGELLRSIDICQNVSFMYLKQRVILCEPRVRFKPANDVAGLEEKIHRLNLSSEMKNFLREASSVGYQCLKEEDMLENLVEFDSEQQTNVVLFNNLETILAQFDMVTLINKVLDKTDDNAKTNPDKVRRKDKVTGRKQSCSSRLSDSMENGASRKDGEREHRNPQLTLTQKGTDDIDRCDRAATVVTLTPRNFLYASDLYRLIIYSYLSNITRFYCLALHIGPLVDRQEVVLYEFKIPLGITDLINSFDKTSIPTYHEEPSDTKFEVSLTVKKTGSLSPSDQSKSTIQANVLDLNQLETMFRKTFGSCLQTVADLNMYFRYYISDKNGVKNHQEDKKQRYDRYMAKKSAKKEMKKTKTLVTDTDNNSLSEVANAGSKSFH